MRAVRGVLIACGMATILALTGASSADAQPILKERMVLTFSDPVQVPGAVLPAGKYVFKLAPSRASRNILQIFNEDETKILATTLTIPKERQDPKGDVVLTFGAAGPGAPPALQAYFYPGTIYGHELVYPEQQARDIAMRSRTVVLSHDVEGSDFEKATLRLYNDRGEPQDYVAADPSERAGVDKERRASTAAPMIMAERQGTRVKLDDLEDHPAKYAGQRISVDAEVQDVLGPRLFTIDEANWADLDGEILVFAPSFLAALVSEDDTVTISGTMKPFMEAEFEREWGWINDNELEADLGIEHVLVADRVVGGNNDLALKITTDPKPVGTTGGTTTGGTKTAKNAHTAKGPALTSVAAVASARDAAVGRSVDIDNVIVDEVAKDGGFWVRDTSGKRAFVLPSDRDSYKLTSGQRVSLEGVLLEMPRAMRDRVTTGTAEKPDFYVFATTVNM